MTEKLKPCPFCGGKVKTRSGFGTVMFICEKCGADVCFYGAEKEPKATAAWSRRAVKTCKNITENHPMDEFICSECGFMTEDFSEKRVDMDDGEVSFYEYEIKYCPNCGAKVVEE